jgi:16S rRNA (adenine1518-N6/adenine1519-N6)-dimethyltransferase
MRPKKHLGQHFLTSPAYARRIAEAVPAGPQDHVLEIGPGQGSLTVFLKERFAGLHCVEIDGEAIVRLREKLGQNSCTIHQADVLDFDFRIAGFPLHVVGNLPYSIGAMIIKKTLLYGTGIRSFTFMVQREVAERISSAPHKKTNGYLTIFCQFFGKPELLFHVPPGAFFPRPKVDSSVVRIVVDHEVENRLPAGRWKDFFLFVSRAFSMRRKKLANVISEDPAGRKRAEELLAAMKCNPLSRPEDLGAGEWLELYRLWTA